MHRGSCCLAVVRISGTGLPSTAAGIQVIDPRGNHLGIIGLPSVARNVACGGQDRRTLYLTALDSRYRVQRLAEGPAGRSK